MVRLFRVVFSRRAKNKLKDISDYHRRNSSPTVAKKVRKGIVDKAKKLDKLPESNPLLKSKTSVDPPYRYTRKWSYKIIFQVFKKNDEVLMANILHDKEDPEKWEDL